jgi:hypothetical protein
MMTPREMFIALFGQPYRKRAARVLGCSVQYVANIACGSMALPYQYQRAMLAYAVNKRRGAASSRQRAVEQAIRKHDEGLQACAMAETVLKAMMADRDRNGPQRGSRHCSSQTTSPDKIAGNGPAGLA